jgi:uncharacterized SAM-binding protein YcdF (DUF218 family)
MTYFRKSKPVVDDDPAMTSSRVTVDAWRLGPCIVALLLTFLLAGGLVTATFFVVDGPSAMRAATDLAMPLGLFWCVTFFFAALALLRGRWTLGIGLVMGWISLGLIGNDFVARRVMGPVEWPRDPSVLADKTPFRAVVSLGGSISIDEDGTFELGSDGQRVMLAAQLWHAGAAQSVICTGSASDALADPSVACRAMLESVGLPPASIYEIKGHNTFEEMQSLKQFLLNPPEGFPEQGRIGLITSAFHMRRAMRLAQDRNLELVALPCSYRVGAQGKFSPRWLIPDAGSASTLATACKERLAALVGR